MAIFRYISPENGLGAKDPIIDGEVVDDPRIDYLSSHIGALEKALALGADVRGYYPWSFIDLLSWLNGYQKQYGFVYVDHQQKSGAETKEEFLLVQICYCQSRRTALIFSCGRHSAPGLILEYS
ncbi:6-phospho-beta-glucosidase A [Klebsiella pneumoniae]|nr:6-phospho-beta-glucosidase A [Klebsiella pneumoniae]